jgi:cell wall-associated NlpC family hydrolase
MASPGVSQLIDQYAPQFHLDPAAVKADASGEGGLGWGAVGDHGTSFGPFQMHIGGAIPKQYAVSSAAASAFANSPAGIQYALRKMAESGAANLTGPAAVGAIVRGFERPADIPGAIATRSARYGQYANGQAPPVSASWGPGSGPGNPVMGGAKSALIASLLAHDHSSGGGLGAGGLLQLGMLRQQAQATQDTFGSQSPAAGTTTMPLSSKFPLQIDGPVTKQDTAVVGLAKQYLGTSYHWGGANPKTGFDCSGLLQYTWGKQGVSIPRTTYDQFKAGVSVPTRALRPGDAVFFKGSDSKVDAQGHTLPGHVGMYVGNGKYIQAPHTGDVVKISYLQDAKDFMGGRRFA